MKPNRRQPDALACVAPSALIGQDTLSPEQAEAVSDALTSANAGNTIRAYTDDWKKFVEWCGHEGKMPLPASTATVCAFLTDLAKDYRASTIGRRLVGIAYIHRLKGFPPPIDMAVRTVMRGLRRKLGVRPERKKAADGAVMRRLLATICGEGLPTLRDRALLLLGFAGAFRREALCTLRVEDLTFHPDRMDVLIRRGKEDQEGSGRTIGIPRIGGPLCPVTAVECWLSVLGMPATGWLFRGLTRWGTARQKKPLAPAMVATLVKRACQKAGLKKEDFSGHSLRAGHATQAYRGGAGVAEIMATGGWKSADTVMRYIREADTLRGTSTTAVKLDKETK